MNDRLTTDESDHDILIRLDERVGRLMTWAGEHDKKHETQGRGIWGAISAAVIALFATFIGWLFRN